MAKEKIVVAADHAGYTLKESIKKNLEGKGFEVMDIGTFGTDSVDYPDFGHALARAIEGGQAKRGILVCGSGIGVSMTANRHQGIRAANCVTPEMARLAREHNDANVLTLGERLVSEDIALKCLDAFLETPFEGGRHQRRIEKI